MGRPGSGEWFFGEEEYLRTDNLQQRNECVDKRKHDENTMPDYVKIRDTQVPRVVDFRADQAIEDRGDRNGGVLQL